MTESKPITLDERVETHASESWYYGDDYSSDSFKAGWKECFEWVVRQLTIANRDTAGLSDLIEKHKREIGE